MGRYDQTQDKKYSGVVIGIIFMILAGGGWFYFNQPNQQSAETETKELQLPMAAGDNHADEPLSDNIAIDQTLADTVDLAEQDLPEQAALPDLASSDQAFCEGMLSASSGLAPWLKADQLIRKYTTIANDFSQGILLEKHMRFLKHTQPFAVEQNDSGVFISHESYQRYDKLAAAIDAVDVQAALTVYRKFEPLLLQVYADFGYPADRPLDDIFLKAAAQILAAPVIEQSIEVVRPSVFYKFANQKLEALSPVSKQMLRMGPKNTRIIQNKTRQLVQGLISMKE